MLARVLEERRRLTQESPGQEALRVEQIALQSRVIIVEGISGAGKDALQAHLKAKLADRDVHDYSEGEVLHSWKHLHVDGIAKLRVQFMRLFAQHMERVIGRDDKAVFLLNRFHLSTYASTVHQQPKLTQAYQYIVSILTRLPVHIFILQLDENEMDKRSLHPERSAAWQKFQQQLLDQGGFRGRLEKQQQLILAAAAQQRIPYSIIKVAYEPEATGGRVRISEAPTLAARGLSLNTSGAIAARRKRSLPPIL